MRISDWSSDVCSSDLICPGAHVDLSGTLCHLTRNPPNQDWLYFMPDDAMKDEIESRSLIEMTTSVVAAYLSNNNVASGQIAEVIHTVHGDRKSVGEGKCVSVRVDLGGRRLIQKKHRNRFI